MILENISGRSPGKMDHVVAHDLGRELAKKATVAAIQSYVKRYEQYSPRTTWTGDYQATVALRVKGIHLEGRMDIRDQEIAMNLDVPFVLRPFRARALQIIDREIGAWMARAKAGEFS
ncbi:MAG: polyhydroxyalkanoic acid system family protein [Polyangiaceae bacterium]